MKVQTINLLFIASIFGVTASICGIFEYQNIRTALAAVGLIIACVGLWVNQHKSA